ncbi:12135_t:CDS:2 [Ambispora leptoticha]|uniref:L-dopachrome isomerase n=1 Tax=Ambispora leptoticha TaxID=144679 RepID=A0A9N9DD19_9GLOM|nr:12135_t:CDS:2 [Ambispora leptoticha]
MPSIEVKTNVKVQNHAEFLKEISILAATLLPHPVEGMNVALQDGLSLLFANSDAPAYIVHINCLGGFGDNMKNREISKAFANFLTEKTGAPSNRGYLFFNDPGYANVGFAGTTTEETLLNK